MDSLFSLLSERDLDEPVEIRTIKDYVRRHFESSVTVSLQQRLIIICTPSAALAGSLRMHLHKLQKELETDRRLIIRIG